MSSHSKRIGDIGEINIIAKLLTYDNVSISKPIGDNCPYDLIIDINGKLYKTQVKTTERVKNGVMIFSVCSNNPWKVKQKIYTKDEIDLFAFYCVENGFCGLAKREEVGDTGFSIRDQMPKYGRKSGCHLVSDYILDKKIAQL